MLLFIISNDYGLDKKSYHLTYQTDNINVV
ncbi:uncharacterized protein METZ01_LOCUS140916 [marine metagenome]|uniref:Uncharacterized protein n=1 Tax=marine metagenome TaxID=408172 RepID=A0A381ZGU7_9ZZZZ